MLFNNENYFQALENIKTQIQNARYRAVLGVNYVKTSCTTNMKAKYGKLSVLCVVIFMGLAHFTAFRQVNVDEMNSWTWKLVPILFLLSPLMGLIFGIIGAVKKETPLSWWLTGFLFNLFFGIIVFHLWFI